MLTMTDRSDLQQIQISVGNVDGNNGQSNWNEMYRAINRCNSVLKNVPNITDPALANRKERIVGEAYFLRALAYFYLVRTFDNVPLILEPFEGLSADFYPTQATPKNVFNQIESDLKAAETRITSFTPYGLVQQNKGRTTAGSIKAALTDFYLWEKKYTQAATKAAEVLAGPYNLVSGDNYASIFTAKNTSESIFEIQFNNTYLEKSDNGAGSANGLTDLFLPIGGVTGGLTYRAGFWYFQPSAKLINSFEAIDKRKNTTFQNTGNPPAPFRDPNLFYSNKYLGTLANENTTRFQDANFIIYRLSDVILMYAEALNESNQTDLAVIQLNRIRNRAGLANTAATTQDAVRLAIEEERFRELAFEGKRYFDLKRTGRYAAVTGNTNPNWLRWPIFSNELTLNKNLVQNTGY